jgi:hypothetical protein
LANREGTQGDVSATFDLEKVFKIIDEDRMDILSTLIRVTLVEIEATLAEGLLALRPWEALSRAQLSRAQGPGAIVLTTRNSRRLVIHGFESIWQEGAA